MLISEISGINQLTGEPWKDTDKLIDTFTKKKDLDILKLLKQCIPECYYGYGVQRIIRYIECDLDICIDVKTLSKPFDQVLDTCDYKNYLTENIQYGCFEFKDRMYLVYRKVSDPVTKIIEMVRFYSIQDFIEVTKGFNVSVIGENGYHTYIDQGEGWYEEKCDGLGGELTVFDCYTKFFSLMKTHCIVSDSEFGIELTKKV